MSAPVAVKILLLLVSGQTADIALVPVATPSGLSRQRSAEVAAELGDVLRNAGLVVAPDRPTLPRPLEVEDSNAATPQVVAWAAGLLDATVAVRVEGGELGDRMVLALEAVNARTGEKLAAQTLTTQASGDHPSWETDLQPFIDALRAAAASHPLKVAAAPVEPEPSPQIVERVVTKSAVPRSVYLAPVALGGLMLAGSTAALVTSRQRHAALTDPEAPTLSSQDAQRTALEGQSLQSLAVAGFITGTLAAAAGATLWILSAPAEDGAAVSLSGGPGQLSVQGRF